MAYNLCTPSAIFNPIGEYQYLFLGCSIQSFSCSLGLNEQNSEVTVSVVEDCATPPEDGNAKAYWDSNLNFTTFRGPDPGFMFPHVGSPVYFRVADFEFSGIIAGYTQSNSESGSPVYNIKIIDPRQILAGCQVIMNDYAGGVGNIANCFNVFGYLEQFDINTKIPEPFESVCNESPNFGTASGFGGAQTTNNGISWNRLLTGMRLLTCSIPSLANTWSYNGRIIYKGPKVGGYGVMPADDLDMSIYTSFSPSIDISSAYHDGNVCYYLLDLEELPLMPDDFRIQGTSISILDVITQVCDVAGYDYFIELIPVRIFGAIYKFIKVRTINRNNQPLLNIITNYVQVNGVNESSIGTELRDEIMSCVYIGSQKETVGEFTQNLDPDNDPDQECLDDLFPGNDEADDIIQPFMGYNSDGSAIVGELDPGGNGFWGWIFDASLLRKKLKGDIGVATTILINEEEILCAKVGMDSWQLWAYAFNTELKQLIDPDEELLGKMTLDFGVPFAVNPENLKHLRAADFMNFGTGKAEPRELEIQHNLEMAFEFISTLANEYYGRKFMVRTPTVCLRQDSENGQILTSEEPVDSGWTDESTILGLTNPSSFLDFVSTEEGKIIPFARYDNADLFEVKDIDNDEYGLLGNTLYLKASVEPGYVYADLSTFCSPRVVVDIDVPPFSEEPDKKWLDKQVGALIKAMQGLIGGVDPAEDELATMTENNKNLLLLGISQKMIIPDSIAIPFRSNINRYGPWISNGPPGQVKFEINDDLNPWNYGGQLGMCIAGQNLASEGITFQQAVESGSITLPGYPGYKLGVEFNSPSNPDELVENRDITTNGFSETAIGQDNPTNIDYATLILTAGSWSGIYGPTITDISVNAGQGGVLTTYSFRTYVQKAGRLAKLNSERLKKVGVLNHKQRKLANTVAILKELNKKRRKKGK